MIRRLGAVPHAACCNLDCRAHVTPRFVRHFNVIGYVDMSDDDKRVIFNTILGNFLSTGFEASLTR